MGELVRHYLSDDIDPLYLRAARDFLFPWVIPGRVLNIGVGYGVWDERISRDCTGPSVSIDTDAALIAHFAKIHPAIEYRCIDALAYEPAAGFDTVVASHILEHLDEPPRLMRKWAGWLRPGGRVIVVVPNAHSIHRHIGVQMGLLRALTELNEADLKIGHRRVYSPASLADQLRLAGLKAIKTGGVTLKTLANAQLATMPRRYVEACCRLADDIGDLAAQLYAVLEK